MKITTLICISFFLLTPAFGQTDEDQGEPTPKPANEFSEDFYNKVSDRIYLRFRSEILPEIRELTLLSRKTRKKSYKLKGKSYEKLIVGRVEWIEIEDPRVRFKARIDTGAQTNSIHAEDIVEKQIQGGILCGIHNKRSQRRQTQASGKGGPQVKSQRHQRNCGT